MVWISAVQGQAKSLRRHRCHVEPDGEHGVPECRDASPAYEILGAHFGRDGRPRPAVGTPLEAERSGPFVRRIGLQADGADAPHRCQIDAEPVPWGLGSSGRPARLAASISSSRRAAAVHRGRHPELAG